MSFYTSLSRYFDDIFPPRPVTLRFLRERFHEFQVHSVLDVACGSGAYAREFARWGLEVTGLDVEEDMIAQAKERSVVEGMSVDFRVGDMRDLASLGQSFDGVTCLGNSLVHLLQEGEIAGVLQGIKRILHRGGVFILQIVNYDWIMEKRVTQLPSIINEQKGLVFERYYRFRRDGLLDFETVLQVSQAEGGREEIRQRTTLRPTKREELERWLLEAGFKDLRFFGGFDTSPWRKDAPATVVVAGS
ncbi:class I SAM-dependent methyltransferase [Calderihabitans maritimus]|uniref:Type 11 methyltransferase n=1 Tax=Calderihabitans maritimus TaxID=1246530 RepID=A0A1Z5HRA1_9FIRM|nr:class I SAM-dependent methyltransferase [Calderihabitans maritimus]GAW91851.1 type 11 methyltransferase [Calderihabitans maritimus]